MKYTICTTRKQRVYYTAWELGTKGALRWRRLNGDALPTIGMVGQRNARGEFRRLRDARLFAHRVELGAATMSGEASTVYVKRGDGSFVV